MTTFSILFSRYKWKVVTFGITPAQEILQKAVYDNMSDLEGLLNNSDILMLRIVKAIEEYTAYDR